jgi:hypothetical protein
MDALTRRGLVNAVVGLAAARGPLGGAEVCGVEDEASGLVARRFFCAARLNLLASCGYCTR